MHKPLAPSAKRLRLAIASKRIWPAFQPLVNLSTREIVGFEVLARWTDSKAGNVPPVEFIPVAEKTGCIDELSRHLFKAACEQARNWPGEFFLAFNVSPVQFRNPTLHRIILDEVTRAQFPPERICIEITEGAIIEDDKGADETVRKLKAAGMSLALDDFGTGYGSLCRLHAFPFDKLKIDRKFIQNLESDAASRKIVSSVISLGLSLGMDVVAEGVENAKQADILQKLNCNTAQGWKFGRPVPAEEARALLLDQVAMSRPSPPLNTSLFQKTHQLDGLYDAAPIGLCFIDTNHVHVSVNEKFAAMLDRHPSDMIGKTVHQFFPADLADEVTSILDRVLEGEPVELEEFTVPYNGRILLIVNKRVDDEQGIPLGMSVSAIDITKRKNLEGALRELEDLAYASFELTPGMPWMSDGEGEITYIGSPKGGQVKGVREHVEDWRDQIHPDDAEQVKQEWLDHVSIGGDFTCRFRMKQTDGSHRWMQSKAKKLNGTAYRSPGWIGVISDIHEQYMLEARVRDLKSKALNGIRSFAEK